MLLALASLVAIAYLPGALVYRLPWADRPKRAALAFEERVFWAVIISTVISTLAALALAAAGAYSLRRLIAVDLGLAAILFISARGRLRYAPAAARPSWSMLLPITIVALGAWSFFPSSEYVMGGKDPGTYMNEGIQIAQGGSLAIHDPALAELPAEFRPLFIPGALDEIERGLHEGLRFMGFFVADASAGTVMGQFPHGFPAWIAIAYGLNGLSGARQAVGAWAILGLLAVYFAGARFAGRWAALVAALLLAVNVAEVWYARYPNSELMQQALLFGALLALARAHRDDDPFFAPVAGVLLGAMMFVRLDSLVMIGVIGGGLLLLVADGRRLGWRFLLPLAALLAASAAYFAGFLRAYLAIPLLQVGGTAGLLAAIAALFATAAGLRRARAAWPSSVTLLRLWVPRALALTVAVLAVYAYAFREPVGLLAEHDAYALRVFTWYIGPVGLLAAVAVFVVLAWTRFWDDPVLLTTGALVSVFFFYKIRIVPEHFWLARRYLPVILPFACLMIAAGAFEAWRRRAARLDQSGASPAAWLRAAARWLLPPLTLMAYVAWSFAAASRPVRHHVEYAGLIPQLEQLAADFTDRDLVLVEPRYSSDTHVLATPLAYIYAKRVLLFVSPRPDRAEVAQFVAWAGRTYDRVFLVAEGGFDLASPAIAITPVRTRSFAVPEYESARNAYPREVRLKKFNLNLYELEAAAAAPVLDLDVGGFDDAWVLRVFARQDQDGVKYRWLRDRSFVRLLGVPASARTIVLRAGDGGRPASAAPAELRVFVNDREIGAVTVRGGFADYRVAIPPDVAAAAAAKPTTEVRLLSTTWTPKTLLGGSDDRALGVMLDRIRVE